MATPLLQGLRILDLTQVAVGPYATMLLGFMGAEVIKVESCSCMDIARGPAQPAPNSAARHPGGIPGERPWDRAAHHVNRNANKLSVTLDLATPRGRELFLQLAKVCDVLAENYRASVMERLGLGYPEVSEANPQLVYLKISSQGATGPERDYGSLGSTLEQTTWLASITGYEDGIPLGTNETYPDPLVGMLAVGALMAALRKRRRTGRGSLVDLSQREATIGILGATVLDYTYNGRVSAPTGNTHPMMAPHGVYPCVGPDQWVAISVGDDGQWQGLCRAIGQPSLADDPRFASQTARRQNRPELDEIITYWTQERGHTQAMHLLQAHGVAAGAVLKGIEVIRDPHLQARGFWDTVNHPEAGEYVQVTTPWRLSRDARRTATPAPGLGEHNAYVLGEILGLSERQLEDLQEEGIIGDRPVGA